MRRPTLGQRLALLREAVRGIWQGPISSSDPNLREFFGAQTTATGVPVSEATAMTYAAVWSAVNCISGDIAALPLNMYRRQQDGGKEKFTSNPLFRLVHDQPNPEMTSIAWRRTTQAHALTWGGGYSEIVRDGAGRPSQFWPITPDRVTPYRRGSDSGLEYRIVQRDGSDSFIPAEDMLHIPGLGFDGIRGYSVISKARESIGLGMAAERFGETFFGNGATFGGVISYTGPKPPELSDKNYRDALNSQHQGVDKAHKFLALYNGASYTRLGIPPNDAQFLETRKFQISEIARWFNLPPHKLGDLERATHSNIEQQTIDYYTGTLLPWLKVWEQELFIKLVPGLERNIQFFEHVIDGLLRADSQMRAESFSKQFSIAAILPNEVRDAENRNPIPGGDEAYVPLNLIPLGLARPWFEAEIELKKANTKKALEPPPTPVAPVAPAADPALKREIELLTEARDTARRCAQEAEDAKDRIAVELATLTAERTHERNQWATEREGLTAQRASSAAEAEHYKQSVEDYAQQCGELASARDALTADVARLTAQATSLGTDLSTAQRDLAAAVAMNAVIEADYQRVCGEKTTAEQARDEAITRAERAEADSHALRDGLVSVRAEVDAAKQETSRAMEQIATLTAEATRLTGERAHADEVNQATVNELRGQIEAITRELASSTAALLEARTAIGTLEGTREAARAELATADQEVIKQTELVQHVHARLRATQQAIRWTVVDAANRLIAKETERARKAQASPEKLGAWIHTFYPIHEDFCRIALKPAVRAVLVSQGSEASVDRVLDSVVLAHISESSRQLQGVIQDSDVESLAPALERVLRRWEAERAEALADRIIKEAA